MPQLSRIIVYPIKSLDGVEVDRARVLPHGGLEYDRRFTLVDGEGRVVNGKRTPALHAIRTEFDLDERTVWVRRNEEVAGDSFQLDSERAGFEAWLSDYLKTPVRLIEDPAGRPDDTAAAGPTVISTATLYEISTWYSDLAAASALASRSNATRNTVGKQFPDQSDLQRTASAVTVPDVKEMRRRFRANLEIDAAEPFWEDRLFAESGRGVPFRVGRVHFVGVNPCRRCVVPARSSESGQSTPDFAAIFARRRRETLPVWAKREPFDGYYRLAVNTRLSHSNTADEVRVGDPVILGEPR